MAQKRNKTGVQFEKEICESKGWAHKSTRPKIYWSGKGRSNFRKIASVDFDPTKFLPNMEKSEFDKFDAITEKNEKIEIKKYKKDKLSNWVMYSEPIFKVATRSQMKTVVTLFGDGDVEKSVKKYNEFVDGIVFNVGEEIINNITKSNIGIQCMDSFISQDEVEYRWNVRSGWKGYNRLSIEFRLKSK